MKGFLLKRTVISINSTCNDINLTIYHETNCWSKGLYKNVIILLVDALRYDFVKEYTKDKSPKLYHNRLIYLNNLLKNYSLNAKLFQFIADPPTTTLQRLKGLTTGSLPTFIDAGSNFATSEIIEDNLIDQIVNSNLKIFFTGDDTWSALFPQRFHESFSYPSFNVKDLDTVDNGVIQKLLPALMAGYHNVYIGHMLGVDHCGHTFGPNHIKMVEKLTLIDHFVKNIIEHMDNESLLLVLGDHGMTEHGDHGGDSRDEVTAALFAYSKKPFNSILNNSIINQIDLVPTISLLLGIPIPFQNLGTYIKALTPLHSTNIQTHLFLLKALHVNIVQVMKYIQKYNTETNFFSDKWILHCKDRFTNDEFKYQKILNEMIYVEQDFPKKNHRVNFEEQNLLESIVNLSFEYEDFIKEICEKCRSVWAQFDFSLINSSLILMPFLLFFNLSLINIGVNAVVSFISVTIIAYIMFFLYVTVNIMRLTQFYVFISFFCNILIFFFIYFYIYSKLEFGGTKFTVLFHFNKIEVIIFFIYILYLLSFFSNSFVVYEGLVSKYFLISVLLLQYIYQLIKCNQILPYDIKKSLKNQNFKSLIPLTYFFKLTSHFLVLWLCIRISSVFENCREEENSCVLSDFIQSLFSFDIRNKIAVQNFCIICILVLISSFLLYNWLQRNGNLRRNTLLTYTAYAYPIFNIFLVSYWCLQYVMSVKNEFTNPLAQVILIYSLLCVIIPFIFDPIMAITTHQKQEFSAKLTFKEVPSIPDLFKTLKNKFHDKNNEIEEQTILAYGLSTMLSSVHSIMISGMFLMSNLLLSPTHALAIILLTMIIIIMQRAFSLQSSRDEICFVPWNHIITCNLLSSVFFHATGHEATFSSIHWGAAFHGTTPDSYSIIPVFLVLFNTFSSHILVSLTTPLFIFSSTKEVKLVENSMFLTTLVFDLSIKNIFIYALRLCVIMLVAVLHRRHLMVWKIFAPRLIYEVITFIIVIICNILNICLFARLQSKVAVFINNLAKVK